MNGHRSVVLWFIGLSGSRNLTLANAIEERLYDIGGRTFVLDGDNVRQCVDTVIKYPLDGKIVINNHSGSKGP